MTINDKIKQILIDKNLTPSYFADEIGVQRSSISHILSGRNRPSFDIIQKIIRRFPELGYEWIMEEESQFANQTIPAGAGYGTNRSVGRPQSIERSERFTTGGIVSPQPQSQGIRSQRTEIPPVSLPPQVEAGSPSDSQPGVNPSSDKSEKKVERILIFYTDGSFREYTPTA